MRSLVFIAALATSAVAGIAHAQPHRPAQPARGGTARPQRGGAARPQHAGAPRTGSPRPQDTLSLADATTALHSNDPDQVIQGIDALTVLGTPAAVPPIVELLRSGPIDRVTDYAVEKLGIIGQPAAIEELSNLLQHRRPQVRVASVVALSQIHDDRVRPLIESALHDSDPQVRGAAATALGEIGARQSVPLLFVAFERGVPEAAESIGRLGEASAAVSPQAAWDHDDPRTSTHPKTLAMWLGHAPLSVLLRGFERYLNRSDVPAATKEQIVVRLEQQASAQVRDFLQRWVGSLPQNYHGPDRARAELAIQQIHVPSGGGSQ